jgi:hypothetical protein
MRQLTIQRVMLITIFTLIFVMATRVPVDTDTWWHIRSGEHTLNEGMIHGDPFSHTMQGEEWINHSWGTQILMYGVWEIAGNVGLALYTATLATAGMAMLYPICTGNVYARGFVLALGAAAAAIFWSARPQMVSFFFSSVILYLLYVYKMQQKDRLWFIPLLIWVWGNMHAGFSIAFILIGGFLAGEVMNHLFNSDGEDIVPWEGLKKLVLVTVVSIGTLVINPYGFKMLAVPFQTLSIGALQDYIEEWNSPNFHVRATWPFVMLLFATFGAAGASNKRLNWTDFFLVSGTAFMAFMGGRNIAVFAVVAMPVLTIHLHAMLEERGWAFVPMRRVTKSQARLNMLLVGVILLGGLSYIASGLNSETVDEVQREHLPVQAVEFIVAEELDGPMFNSYNWGGYLMFALPEYPVYVDGRTDLYKNEFLTDYLNTAVGRDGWREELDAAGVNFVLIETGSGLAQRLNDDPGWTQVYPNDDYEDLYRVIYVRDAGAGEGE